MQPEVRKAIIVFLGVPGTLIMLPAIIVLLLAGFFGLFDGFHREIPALQIAAPIIGIVAAGGALGLLGFWSWALNDPRTTSARRLKFTILCCVIGAITLAIAPGVHMRSLLGAYLSLGIPVGLWIAADSWTILRNRSQQDGSETHP